MMPVFFGDSAYAADISYVIILRRRLPPHRCFTLPLRYARFRLRHYAAV